MEEVRNDASKASRIISLAMSGKVPLQDLAAGKAVSARKNKPKKKKGMVPNYLTFHDPLLTLSLSLSLSLIVSIFLSLALTHSLSLCLCIYLSAPKTARTRSLSALIGMEPNTERPKSACGQAEYLFDEFDDDRESFDDGE